MSRGGGTDDLANASNHEESPYEYHDDTPSNDSDTLLSADAAHNLSGLARDGSIRSPQASWTARIKQHVPSPMVSGYEAVVKWVKGPQPPRPFSIKPFFPRIQHAPLDLLDRYFPKRIHRFWLLTAFYLSWILAFWLIQWKSSAASDITGYGSPVRLWCGARYWYI